jgi:hypothetical protein
MEAVTIQEVLSKVIPEQKVKTPTGKNESKEAEPIETEPQTEKWYNEDAAQALYKFLYLKRYPGRWSGKTLDMLKGDIIEGIVKKVTDWNFGSPFLCSIISKQNGIGKTHIAFCLFKKFIYQRFLEDGYKDYLPAHFIKGYDLLDELQGTFGKTKNQFTTEEVYYKYSLCHFLGVDDLFADRANNFERQAMYKILDKRVDWYGLPTVITSNLSLAEIYDIDSRIGSRINNSMLFEINTKLDDWRTK